MAEVHRPAQECQVRLPARLQPEVQGRDSQHLCPPGVAQLPVPRSGLGGIEARRMPRPDHLRRERLECFPPVHPATNNRNPLDEGVLVRLRRLGRAPDGLPGRVEGGGLADGGAPALPGYPEAGAPALKAHPHRAADLRQHWPRLHRLAWRGRAVAGTIAGPRPLPAVRGAAAAGDLDGHRRAGRRGRRAEPRERVAGAGRLRAGAGDAQERRLGGLHAGARAVDDLQQPGRGLPGRAALPPEARRQPRDAHLPRPGGAGHAPCHGQRARAHHGRRRRRRLRRGGGAGGGRGSLPHPLLALGGRAQGPGHRGAPRGVALQGRHGDGREVRHGQGEGCLGLVGTCARRPWSIDGGDPHLRVDGRAGIR
mmetsp:Transcript_3137/g.10480  ORF Transcript_3137/g.10480 Transcript_3137/m.10480 type:complete len:367 (+) Transcript_3137:131-1231(+)